MPIEIRELVIRTTVVAGPPPPPPASVDLAEAKREIVEACLEEIRDELERKAER